MDNFSCDSVGKKLIYDRETGLLTWIARGPGRSLSKPAGSKNGNGYIQILIDGKRFKAHRVAWLLAYGLWPKGHIDHINGNRSDNRICNLRDLPPELNAQNRRTRAAGSNQDAPFGTMYHKRDKRWIAQIYISGKKTHIGSFLTANEAHFAYVLKKREVHPASTL